MNTEPHSSTPQSLERSTFATQAPPKNPRSSIMTSQTTERAFENAVESTLLNSGWQKADVSGWDVGTAIFPQTGH